MHFFTIILIFLLLIWNKKYKIVFIVVNLYSENKNYTQNENLDRIFV